MLEVFCIYIYISNLQFVPPNALCFSLKCVDVYFGDQAPHLNWPEFIQWQSVSRECANPTPPSNPPQAVVR